MGLSIEPNDFVGKTVIINPQYGWGWSQLNDEHQAIAVDFQRIHDAGPFRVRVKSFFSFNEEIRGFTGQVEEPGHVFDQQWSVCATRAAGEFNFSDRLCRNYEIQLGPIEPEHSDSPKCQRGSPIYNGYASVTSSI
jgi:hypothetical protein